MRRKAPLGELFADSPTVLVLSVSIWYKIVKMRKIEGIFNLLSLPIDALMVFGAFLVAYFARAASIPLPVVYIWPIDQYLKLAVWMVPLWILSFGFIGLYSHPRARTGEFGKIIAAASIGAMVLVLWVFLNRSDFFSRIIIFYIWALSIVFVSFGRAALGFVRSNPHLFGLPKKRLALIARVRDNLNFVRRLESAPSLNCEIAGIIAPRALELKSSGGGKFKYLGRVDEMEKILKKKKIDEVISADTQLNDEAFFMVMRACQENDVAFKAIPAHAQAGARTLHFDALSGVPIIEFKGTPLDSWGAVIKRLVDLIGSALAIAILSPVFLVIALTIKLNSKGPVIYRNVRVGRRGEFVTLKFRTMRIECCTGTLYGGARAENFEKKLIQEKNIKKGDAVYKIADDPRVTRVGRFLRKTSLDELPQFLNVFKGNMSLVGPRPHQPREVKHYTKEQKEAIRPVRVPDTPADKKRKKIVIAITIAMALLMVFQILRNLGKV